MLLEPEIGAGTIVATVFAALGIISAIATPAVWILTSITKLDGKVQSVHDLFSGTLDGIKDKLKDHDAKHESHAAEIAALRESKRISERISVTNERD